MDDDDPDGVNDLDADDNMRSKQPLPACYPIPVPDDYRVGAVGEADNETAVILRVPSGALEMKKLIVLMTVVGVLVALFAGVAVAKTVVGNDRDNRLVGTNSADTTKGKRGEDDVECGRGTDRVRANPSDDVEGCERVVRVGPRVGDRD